MDITVDGKPAFAATGGQAFEEGRPAIVFIHGGGMDHSVWALQTRYFAYHGRNVLAVDLPGHGRTPGPALTTIAAMADWVMALLDALGIEDAALAGHSMGSLVAGHRGRLGGAAPRPPRDRSGDDRPLSHVAGALCARSPAPRRPDLLGRCRF